MQKIQFSIPLLPPSVNHYVVHGGGFHRKTAEAKGWESAFPLFSRQQFVVGSAFAVTVWIYFGPKDRGDIDNFSKLILDCIAKSGMLVDEKGNRLSDAKVIELHTFLRSGKEDRKLGPKTEIMIESILPRGK